MRLKMGGVKKLKSLRLVFTDTYTARRPRLSLARSSSRPQKTSLTCRPTLASRSKLTFPEMSRSISMMTSSNRNIFHITGPLWGESTGHIWIPLTKASDVELCYFLSAPEQTVEQTRRRWFGTPLRSLWRHCNKNGHVTPFITVS